MFMRVQYNFEKNKTWRDYVDLSGFTGMEVEHGLNTGNLVPMGNGANLGHFDPNARGQSNFGTFSNRIAKE